jgi:hypothetical protein
MDGADGAATTLEAQQQHQAQAPSCGSSQHASAHTGESETAPATGTAAGRATSSTTVAESLHIGSSGGVPCSSSRTASGNSPHADFGVNDEFYAEE